MSDLHDAVPDEVMLLAMSHAGTIQDADAHIAAINCFIAGYTYGLQGLGWAEGALVLVDDAKLDEMAERSRHVRAS